MLPNVVITHQYLSVDSENLDTEFRTLFQNESLFSLDVRNKFAKHIQYIS